MGRADEPSVREGEMAGAMVKAPWTDEQVANLNRFQACKYLHEFTCPMAHRGSSRTLIARPDGWHCPECDYRQSWAFCFMAEFDEVREQHVIEQMPHIDGETMK